MKKIWIAVLCNLLLLQANSQQKPTLNGVWEWDAAAMQGKPMIGKFLSISDQNGSTENGTAKLTFTPEAIQDTYANWTAGTRTSSEVFYNTFDKYYYIRVGGYTNRNAKREIIATGEYIVSFNRLPGTPNHIINGALILRSWNKSNTPTVQNRGGEEVLLVGQWINKTLMPSENAAITTANAQTIISAFTPKSIQVNRPLDIDLPPQKLKWKPTFKITDIEFETLTVDSEKKALDKESGLDEFYRNKAEYRGTFSIGLFAPVNGNFINRWQTTAVFKYEVSTSPRLLVLGLKQIVASKENYSKVFGVGENEFNTVQLRVFGSLFEIDGTFEAPTDYSSTAYRQAETPTALLSNNVFVEVPLKNLISGDNVLDITKNGKTFRLHFTIE